jgi:glycosidase
MSDLAEAAANAGAFANDIATAPGDLPLAQVLARTAAQGHQFRHDNTIHPLAPQPDTPVTVWAVGGADLPLERAALYYTTDGTLPTAQATALPMAIAGVDWVVQAGYLMRWQGVIPPHPAGTVVRYRIGGWRAGAGDTPDPDVWAHDGQGFWFRHADAHGVTTFAYRVEPPGPALPAWATDAVIYQIFLDRFHPGTPGGAFAPDLDPQAFHGGTLRGVQQALPYLAELGVTALWLSPLSVAPSYHRYDATDYYTVDPRLGTNADLRALVDAAHARQIRIILDFVPTHGSAEHPAFVAARAEPRAETVGWFTFYEWPDQYRHFLEMVPSLVTFNTDDPGARAHIIGSAGQWLREYGVDGFRLDHAIGPSMDFWVAFRDAVLAAQPEALTFGEVTDTPDCLRRYRGKLHGVLDFPLAGALRRTFGNDEWTVAQLDGFLRAYERYMAEGPGRVSFLDNHDMNRFLFVAGQDVHRLRLAALCQFTLEGTPVIYYGTEIGLSQEVDIAESAFGGDAEVRRDMPWDARVWDQELRTFYQALIRLRREQPALRHGPRRTVHLDAAAGTYAYERGTAGGADRLLVVFNHSAHERTVALPGGGPPTILFTTAAPPRLETSDSALHVTLAPYSGAVLGNDTEPDARRNR